MPEQTLCLCVAGSDTDAGKTVVTAALGRAALAAGLRVLLLKPVQTGCAPDERGVLQAPDLAVYREAAPGADARTLIRYKAACSPHLAAREQGASLTAQALADGVCELARGWVEEQTGGRVCAAKSGPAGTTPPRNLVVLEGAGGLFTPLNEAETLLDLFALLGWPVVLAAANRLGAVNHALLSLAALRGRGLACPGFIMSETFPARDSLEEAIRRDNPAITARLGKAPCLAELPFLPELCQGDPAGREAAWGRAAARVLPVLEAAYGENNAPAACAEGARPLLLAAPSSFAAAPSSLGADLSSCGTDPSSLAAAPPRGEALLAFDRRHLWHPYTSALQPIRTREATHTSGARIRLADGRELVDGMASWWCAIHGYRHPELMAALEDQARVMPHVMFGGLTHAPAVDLAHKLLGMVPTGLEHVFFADSGSVSVEVAVKMALQYHQATGRTGRTKLLALRGGYHGDTLAAMSVCDPENGMHSLFSGILPHQIFAPRPECRFDSPYDPASEQAFAALLERHAHSLAAVILEPVVQGAGGMWFYHPDFLRAARELCTRHGCLLIADEIATGFGRTGALFACDHAGITPDILCLGKALTGGVMTLAATLAVREVAEGISRGGGVLMHGPTFMANPLACAVAGASLDIIARGDWHEDVPRIAAALTQGLAPCAALPGVAEVRVLGAIGVVEMRRPVNMERLQSFFVEQGVWIRPFGRLIYLMPPYVVTDEDIALLCRAVVLALGSGAWK